MHRIGTFVQICMPCTGHEKMTKWLEHITGREPESPEDLMHYGPEAIPERWSHLNTIATMVPSPEKWNHSMRENIRLSEEGFAHKLKAFDEKNPSLIPDLGFGVFYPPKEMRNMAGSFETVYELYTEYYLSDIDILIKPEDVPTVPTGEKKKIA